MPGGSAAVSPVLSRTPAAPVGIERRNGPVLSAYWWNEAGDTSFLHGSTLMVDGIVDWVTSVVETLGYPGVGAMTALENVFPPIPSEVVLPLAGFVAASGDATGTGMVVAATIGSLVGAYALYAIAAVVGPDRLHRLVEAHGSWLGLTIDDLGRAEQWFDRRAAPAVLVCRCVPLMRSLISIPAGLRRMPLLPFTVYTLIGSLVWNAALVGAGALLGESWRRAEQPIQVVQGGVLIGFGIALAWFGWRRILIPRLPGARSRRRKPRNGEEDLRP